MEKGFLVFSKKNSLIKKGDHILVAVSGGVDSVVLLDILTRLQKKLGIQTAVAHVNYGLRKESDRDHKFVKDLAEKYELPFFDKKVKLTGSNIEERARDIRYGFFKEVCEKEKIDKVAVAHHKNDLVETFFLNLSRGSGLTGLVSMKPKNRMDSRFHENDIVIIRPLLFTTKRETEQYAKKNKLQYVEDVTNKDLGIKRNLIRHKVIPEFEKMNIDFLQVVTQEIEDLREADRVISGITEKYYGKIVKEGKGSASMSIKEMVKISPYLQSEVLRSAIRYVKGDLRDISRKNIDNILNLTKVTHGTKKVMLPQGLLVQRVYDKIEIRKEEKSPVQKPKSIRLEIEKEVIFGRWRLFLGKSEEKNTRASENLVFLDIQKTPTLRVRCRKAGDRISIGQGKTKSLQDVFVDTKIPRDERDSYPVVVTRYDEIVWIPGIRLNPNYRLGKNNKHTVSLKAIYENEKTPIKEK